MISQLGLQSSNIHMQPHTAILSPKLLFLQLYIDYSQTPSSLAARLQPVTWPLLITNCRVVCSNPAMRMLLYCHNVQLAAAAILSYRPLSERLVSMVLSYWRSSAELEDLFSTFMRVK